MTNQGRGEQLLHVRMYMLYHLLEGYIGNGSLFGILRAYVYYAIPLVGPIRFRCYVRTSIGRLSVHTNVERL